MAMHDQPLPASIADYLIQLKACLAGADPALIQDALSDAEEYLRSEMAAQPGSSETEIVASVAASYGHPEEVAQIYRDTEVTVNRALGNAPVVAASAGPQVVQTPLSALVPAAVAQRTDERPAQSTPTGTPPSAPVSVWRKIFGVYTDPHTFGALIYLLLSLATGIFYFTWVVTGGSLSLGMLILIIGVPLLALFLGSVRVLALVEGRLIETLLGVRMPRRAPYVDRSQSWLQRIGAMFTDPRTWATLAYFLLMLPLGIAYFTVAVTGLSLSLALLVAPLLAVFDDGLSVWVGGVNLMVSSWTWPLLVVAGMVLLTALLHLVRGLGQLHGHLAKHLLVRNL